MMLLLKRIINKVLMKTAVTHVDSVSGKTVFLTFDDGPEPEITEFVLDELDKYRYKATFFCKGKNAETYPDLLEDICSRGHVIGNHSYSHHHAYEISAKDYILDVEKADRVLHTHLFRPPNGCLLFSAWKVLRKKYRVIYWTIGSGDWRKENFDAESSMALLNKTKPGDIILFHFSNDLEKGTRRLLPEYLHWLNERNFSAETL